ncbi:MAG: toxic anion resistance protein [Alkalibacterium gilvum]|uniref:toxic anion resistance protein n=1 Tax=Alkalibacterium TaxID=99906 RepID=UPI000EC759CE|nr:toxic anion resistance protein [Alkalibacterium sp.]MDN6295926.1 toxic anion resistance protein [Alkalibacterium sp.]HAJ69756.1 toxic anion resistance protein [Alkalibacterium sp.]
MPTNDSDNIESNNNSEIDDLLANPFGKNERRQETTTHAVTKQATSKRIIDTLSDQRKEQAYDLAKQIDTSDSDSLLNYGAQAQQKLGEFSHSVLNHVQNQETNHIGETLNDLMFRLNETDPNELKAENQNIFKKFFKKINRSIYETTAKYQKIGAQVDKIAVKLDKERALLLKDNEMLNELYDKNYEYFEALNVYIAAGEVKLEEVQNKSIPRAIERAESSNNQMEVQKVNDLNQFLSRLDKRVYDLKTARQMTIQQAPQIRLIQNTNQALSEKIQTSINTAIPLWKNQIVVALTLLRQKEAVTAQRQVSETTNDLLKKNSEMLKQSSIETARENERSIIDIETLEKTQSDLIETLEETLSIQRDGHSKRKEAEVQLTQLESNLRNQLLKLTEFNDTSE